ncbi:hypothetical protein ACP3WA_25345, partial [Salmonella enterica]|uniref:hypothetical protein n=1 Tax=Salmonella enterica TaxID=28901 RepID=UPI003CEEC5C6
MYAPVFCKDTRNPLNEFVGDQREPNLNPDEITGSFTNIMDLGEWDTAKDEGPLREQNRMTLSDPRDKGGVIGAFC